MGSLAGEPGPESCPYCGRRMGPRFTRGLPSRRPSPDGNHDAVRGLPRLGPALTQLREDIRYLAGIVGWPAAIWRVTRQPALNVLAALAGVVVVALPPVHPTARAAAGAILAIQLGRLLLLLRQVRREAAQSRLAQRLAPAARNGLPARAARPAPPAAVPRVVNLGPAPRGRHGVRSDR